MKLALLLLLAFPAVALSTWRAQEDPPAALNSRWLDYLVRRPYHPAAFRSLLEEAPELGGRRELARALRHLAEAAPSDPAPRVLLARLASSEGRHTEALDLLAGLVPDPRLLRLRADLALAAGELEAARADALQALADTLDLEARFSLRRTIALSHLVAGEREAAAAAFLALADEHDKPGHHLDVARELARHGLDEGARGLLERALAAAPGTELRLRTLTELGDLEERAGRAAEAETAWREADTLLARGHWALSGLRARRVDLHRRAGTLAALEADWRARVAASSRLSDSEGLAEVLLARGDLPAARAVLERATAAHPRDPRLVARRADLARRAGDGEAELRLRQRAEQLTPGDAEVDFLLADALLRTGRLSPALERFEAWWERDPDDDALRTRVVTALTEAGATQAAREVLTRAVEELPGRLVLSLALAEQYRAAGDQDGALDLLRDAGAAERPPVDLERVAEELQRLGDREQAAVVLARACDLEDPPDPRRLFRLAELESKLGRPEDARGRWRAILAQGDVSLRERATHAYLATFDGADGARRLLRAEEDRLAAGEGGLSAYLLVAAARARLRDPVGARAALYELLRAYPTDRGARVQLIAALEEAGEVDEALAQLDELAQRFPSRARGFQLEATRLLVVLGRSDEAVRRLEALARASAETAATLREVAAALEDLGHADRAAHWLERAAERDPSDVATLRRLADLAHAAGEADRAYAYLERAHAHASTTVRGDLAGRLADWLAEREEQRGGREDKERYVTGLRARAERQPLAVATTHLAAELALQLGDVEDALALLERSLAIDPTQPETLRLCAQARQVQGDLVGAARDLRALRALEGVDRGAVDGELIEVLLARKQIDEARELVRASPDPLDAAARFARSGFHREAAELLEELLRGGGLEYGAWKQVAVYRRRIDDRAGAIEALEQLVVRAPDDAGAWRDLAELHAQLADDVGAAAAARSFLALDPSWPGIDSWFADLGLLDEYYTIRREQGLAGELGLERLGEVFGELLRRRAGAGVAFELSSQLSDRAPPQDVSAADWSRFLSGWRAKSLQRDRRLARDRLRELRARMREQDLTVADWREYATLLPIGLKTWQYDWELLSAGFAAAGADRQYVEAVALHAEDEGRYDVAADAWTRLVARIDPADDARLRAESWARHRIDVRRLLPLSILEDLDGVRLDRLAAPTFDHGLVAAGYDLSPLDAREVALRGAVALVLAGQEEAGRAQLRGLAPAEDAALASLARYACAWAAAGSDGELLAVHDRMVAGARRLEASGEFERMTFWTAPLLAYREGIAQALERHARAPEAYELLRSTGAIAKARSLLTRRRLFDEVATFYEGRRGEDPEADWKRAEVLSLGADSPGALDAWRVVAEAAPADRRIEALGHAAIAAEASSQRPLAIELYAARIAARDTDRGPQRRPTELVREVPPADRGGDLFAIARLHIEREDGPGLVRHLASIEAEAWSSRQSDQLLQLLLNQKALRGDLDVLEALLRVAPGNVALFRRFTGELLEAGLLDRLERVLEACSDPEAVRGTLLLRHRQLERARGG